MVIAQEPAEPFVTNKNLPSRVRQWRFILNRAVLSLPADKPHIAAYRISDTLPFTFRTGGATIGHQNTGTAGRRGDVCIHVCLDPRGPKSLCAQLHQTLMMNRPYRDFLVWLAHIRPPDNSLSAERAITAVIALSAVYDRDPTLAARWEERFANPRITTFRSA